MPKKQRKFADDGWAIWIDGEDTSTVYINDWLNPKGKSHVDIAIRIRGVRASKCLHVYVPFIVSREEMQDVSLLFQDKRILQATFSAACIVEYKKNEHTTEIAYNGKTIDIVHISSLDYQTSTLSEGTHISIDLEKLQPFLDNDEAYFIWRMPHKSLDEIFTQRADVGKMMSRLRDLLTTPIISEKYGYSIRINEARLLPDEITRIGAFHRQKLKKAVVTLSIDENYELNDTGCYRIHRLEEKLYKDNLQGHFNFYYSIAKNSVSRGSMFLYLVLLTVVGVAGNLIADLIGKFMGL